VTVKLEGTTQKPLPALDQESARLPRLPLGLAEALLTLAVAPPPRGLFPDTLTTGMLPEAIVRGFEGGMHGGFRVLPIFLDSGWRGVPGAVYNKQIIEAEFPEYTRSEPSSKVASAIAEAARNVAQHGRILDQLPPPGSVCFAPGAIFLREISGLDAAGRDHTFLVCMISDEGMGIVDPSLSLLPGVGSAWGENHNGMGYELSDSVLMLIRSREQGWLLFDGLHHSNARLPLESKGVPPLAELQLPSTAHGCQKIFIFQHPQGDAEGLFRTALESVTPLRR